MQCLDCLYYKTIKEDKYASLEKDWEPCGRHTRVNDFLAILHYEVKKCIRFPKWEEVSPDHFCGEFRRVIWMI